MANTRRVTRKHRTERKQEGAGKMVTLGSKAQVFHSTAKHTAGGLTKKDLMKTKSGRIVSKKQHASGLKAIKRLRKMGYTAKKGTFKLFKKMKKGMKGGNMADVDMSGNGL